VNVASLLTLGPIDARLRCECCDLPTIRVPYYNYDIHLNDTNVVCPLCEWENIPLTAEGVEDKGAIGTGERNDGISLAEARGNFSRYLSMYDPKKLQPWMLGPPSAEVLARKRALRDAYTALLSAPEHHRWDPFNAVKDCEYALTAQLDAERENAQDRVKRLNRFTEQT
jgi:hypothetical protein